MPCKATQDGQVTMESSDKIWFTGKWKGKLLQHSCLDNLRNSVKRQKDKTLKDELLIAQYALKNEEIAPERMKSLSQSKNNTQLWM